MRDKRSFPVIALPTQSHAPQLRPRVLLMRDDVACKHGQRRWGLYQRDERFRIFLTPAGALHPALNQIFLSPWEKVERS